MTKSLALDPHDPSLVEIYYHHAPAFRRVSLRLFGIGISLVYCLIHLHIKTLRRLNQWEMGDHESLHRDE
jgi:hypothetical protein